MRFELSLQPLRLGGIKVCRLEAHRSQESCRRNLRISETLLVAGLDGAGYALDRHHARKKKDVIEVEERDAVASTRRRSDRRWAAPCRVERLTSGGHARLLEHRSPPTARRRLRRRSRHLGGSLSAL